MLLSCVSTPTPIPASTLISTQNIDCNDVINDFLQKFDEKRFENKVLFVRDNHNENIFDSVIITSSNSKNAAWSEIHNSYVRCDFIVTNDKSLSNSFILISNQSYKKFFVSYSKNNKISKIKIWKPKVTLDLTTSPCN